METVVKILDEVKVNNKAELLEEIDRAISINGVGCDLNHIDVSKVTDFSGIFNKFPEFNGSICYWNTESAKTFKDMFKYSKFNGDISGFCTSNVVDFTSCFELSRFSGDISGWDVKSAKKFDRMFKLVDYSDSNYGDLLSYWNPSKVESMEEMFMLAVVPIQSFTIWNVSKCKNFKNMFYGFKSGDKLVNNKSFDTWQVSPDAITEGMFNFSNFDIEKPGWFKGEIIKSL